MAVLRWDLLLKRLFRLPICPPRLLPHLPAGPRQPCAPGATLELQLQPGALTLAPAEALDSSQQEALRGCVGLEVRCDRSSCSACAAAGAPPPYLFTRFSWQLGSAAGARLFQVDKSCTPSFVAAHHEQLAQEQCCTVVVQLDSMDVHRRLRATASWQREQQQPQGQEQQAPKLLEEEQEPELGQQEQEQARQGGEVAGAWCRAASSAAKQAGARCCWAARAASARAAARGAARMHSGSSSCPGGGPYAYHTHRPGSGNTRATTN
jgi:hypothetical protein